MALNIDKSYLTNNESNSIKGILILLIILGHDMCFTYPLERYQVMSYLYLFHIQAFFMLPFVYNVKTPSISRLKNYIIRLYWPFIIFSTILYFVFYIFYQKNSFDLKALLYLWYSGESINIKRLCGNQILWFLPAMFSLSLLKDIYYYRSYSIKFSLILLSCLVLTYYLFFIGYFKSINSVNIIESLIPFGIFSALQYFAICIFLRYIISRINLLEYRQGPIGKLLISFLSVFVIFSVLYFCNVIFINNLRIMTLLRVSMPLLFFVLVYLFRKDIAGINWLRKIGELSFPIYLIHPFIGYALYWAITTFWSLNVLSIALSLICIAGFSYYLAKIIFGWNPIRSFFFPRTYSEFIGLFKTK